MDEAVEKAQSLARNARRSSLQAAFDCFKSQLENDAVQHRKHMLAAQGNEIKQRAAIVSSLEVGERDFHKVKTVRSEA